MIEKYFNGVIEQVYSRIGQVEKNIVMARYSNDFSVLDLDTVKRYLAMPDGVFFSCCELEYDTIVGGYEPFLDTICSMFRKYGEGSFEAFLSECNVYYLQRGVLESYYETGKCVRREKVLLSEVKYERNRMTEAIASMLRNIAKKHPLMIVINRFQLASANTMDLVLRLILEPSSNLGIVLCVNEMPSNQEGGSNSMNAILESLEDISQIYHIGSSPYRRAEGKWQKTELQNREDVIQQISNLVELLDYEQALEYLSKLEKQIRFEEVTITDSEKFYLYSLYIKVSILCGDIPKALELAEELSRLNVIGRTEELHYYSELYRGNSYMYQGKLQKGIEHAKKAKAIARAIGNEELEFEAELLEVQNQMSGWYNIFFCAQDVPISETFIEKLMQYGYKNNLAHIYIYAYDNRPEVVAKAYRSEAALVFFSKGIAIAKEIGNEELVYSAYQKNIMIAATNGMHEISILYSVRTFQFMKNKNTMKTGRIYSGLGYNLSALGDNERAEQYFRHALQLFYQLRLPEDIAEVQYNMALNDIMRQNYAQAEHELLLSMKTIERLHLNSLRVCNLSKMYGLLALVSILQNDRFNCERYLLSCSQFLNYILEKEKEENQVGIIHDYAKCDDDMFLYTFSKGLLYIVEGKDDDAFYCFEQAEKYLMSAEGNQFFVYRLFRQKRMELFQKLGRMELFEKEQSVLQMHEEVNTQAYETIPLKLLREVEGEEGLQKSNVTESMMDSLMKQEGVARDLKTTRNQMEFISSWQKLIDVNGMEVSQMVDRAIRVFLNHFNNDCALYIRYHGNMPDVLYNDTGVEMDEATIEAIGKYMNEYPQGLAVSKISANYTEHLELISIFGADDVCSIVAIPFFKNHHLKSVLITYVRMRENWHSSIDRYMLNEDDLNIYQLLFREMSYSINRMEAYEKVFEMNSKLAQAAVTDMLTGIYNRAGMYQEIEKKVQLLRDTKQSGKMGLMFIDLDNFKHYNDTFGHDVGDIILKSMAAIFTKAVEGKGFVSRFGGDEFILILDTDAREELEQIACHIYEEIEKSKGFAEDISKALGQEITVDSSCQITCSIGIATSQGIQEENDINSLIRKADNLLYKVKVGQKGTYAFI